MLEITFKNWKNLGQKNRIALVTTWYPPQMSVATNRMLSFTEFLSEDFEVEVFCLDNKTRVQEKNGILVHFQQNKSLLNLFTHKTTDSKLVHVVKTGARVLLSKFIDEPLKYWKKNTLTNLIKRHSEKKFDLIISSFAPQEAHQVVLEFKKDYKNVHWIADMRDEMSGNVNFTQEQQEKLAIIERAIDKYATAITSVSKPIVDGFAVWCPSVKHRIEIRNGFNHDFQRDIAIEQSTTKLRFGYFGNFYGSRKPHVLFSALEEFKAENPTFQFEFEIYGAHNNFTIPESIKDEVKMFPGLPYMEAIHRMAEMDVNVLIHPASGQKGVFTGKLFDYISVRRAVLALVDPKDVAAKLIAETNGGYVADCLDFDANYEAIELLVEDWKNNRLRFASQEDASQLHRKNQVAKLVQFIHVELGL